MLAADCSTHDIVCWKCGQEWDGTVCKPQDNDGVQCGFEVNSECECFEDDYDTA